MTAPALSVVVPVHDEEAVIDDVVAAIVREILDAVPASELVIVDDASNDSTPARLAAHAAADPRVKVLRNDVNRGHGPEPAPGDRRLIGRVDPAPRQRRPVRPVRAAAPVGPA